MRLRDYQTQCVDNVLAELRDGSQSTLMLSPTGTGKTVIFGHVIQQWGGDSRVLVLAHRAELIYQAADKIERILGDPPEVEMGFQSAERHNLLSRSRVIVGSIQTQNSGAKCADCDGCGRVFDSRGDLTDCSRCVDGRVRRMQKFDPAEFGLVIIDEAHHAPAKSYRRVIDYYGRNPNLKILGCTATADRLDEQALGQVFDSVSFEYGIEEAISDGWLVPIEQQYVECAGLDFRGCRTTAGDLNGADLEEIMLQERAVHEVVAPTAEIAGTRATLVFASSVAHAETMAELLNRYSSDSAICIHGGTPADQRRDLLAEYAAGKYQYLVGCGVFLEGFDEPRIEVVAMARPTKSRALYAQAVGRGTRPLTPPAGETPDERRAEIAASPKRSMLVLDFVGNSGRHKLVSTADLLGGKYEDDVIARAVSNAQGADGIADMTTELEIAQRQIRRETEEEDRAREAKQRRHLKAKSRYNSRSISPFDIFDITPARTPGWHKGRKFSEKQISVLKKAGIEHGRISYVDGQKIIGEIFRRRKENLCTYKQATILTKYGEETTISFTEASSVIDEIAKNGWKPRTSVH